MILSSLVLILSFNFLFLDFTKAQSSSPVPNTGTSDTAVQAIGTLNPNGQGIIDCNRISDPNSKACSPADFFKMLTKLGKLFLYILIICIGLGGIIIGAMYPFYGDNPAMLAKMKGAVIKFFEALVVIVLATGLVFALMKQLGADSTLLNIIQKLISSNSLIETSYAQNAGAGRGVVNPPVVDPNAPTPPVNSGGVSATGLKEASDSAMKNGHYTNFFGSSDPIVLIHNLISFLVTYIFIPMLVLAVIWTGFLFVKAQGNEKEIENAKKWALRSVLGIVIAASATFLSDMFFNSLSFILNS